MWWHFCKGFCCLEAELDTGPHALPAGRFFSCPSVSTGPAAIAHYLLPCGLAGLIGCQWVWPQAAHQPCPHGETLHLKLYCQSQQCLTLACKFFVCVCVFVSVSVSLSVCLCLCSIYEAKKENLPWSWYPKQRLWKMEFILESLFTWNTQGLELKGVHSSPFVCSIVFGDSRLEACSQTS